MTVWSFLGVACPYLINLTYISFGFKIAHFYIFYTLQFAFSHTYLFTFFYFAYNFNKTCTRYVMSVYLGSYRLSPSFHMFYPENKPPQKKKKFTLSVSGRTLRQGVTAEFLLILSLTSTLTPAFDNSFDENKHF